MGQEAIPFTPESAGQRIDQVIIGYERSEGFRNLELNTQKAYRIDLNQFRSHLLQHEVETFAKLKPEHFNSWISKMQSSYKPTTVTRKVKCIRGLLREAVAKEIISPDFVEDLPPVYLPKKKPPEGLTAGEVNSLIEKAKKTGSLRNLAIILLLLETGGKINQILKLNRRDISFRNGQALVRLRRAREEKEFTLEGSTGEIIHDFLQEENYRSPNEPLFLSHGGHRLTRQGFWLHLKSYGRSIGISDLSAPMIRNTWQRKLRSAS